MLDFAKKSNNQQPKPLKTWQVFEDLNGNSALQKTCP